MFQLRHYFHKNGIICGKKRYKESNNYWGEGKNKKADCSVRGEKGKKENWLNDALVLTCRTSFGGTSKYVSASGNQVDTYCWGEPPWERPPWFAKIWIARCNSRAARYAIEPWNGLAVSERFPVTRVSILLSSVSFSPINDWKGPFVQTYNGEFDDLQNFLISNNSGKIRNEELWEKKIEWYNHQNFTDKAREMIQQRNNVLTKHECEGMDVIGCLVYIGGPIGMAGFTEDRDDGMEEVPRSSARFVGWSIGYCRSRPRLLCPPFPRPISLKTRGSDN